MTSVCSSTKESEVKFGNAVSASMEVTSESQLALQIWYRQKKKRMSCTLRRSSVIRRSLVRALVEEQKKASTCVLALFYLLEFSDRRP
jgi:hypothetical protein